MKCLITSGPTREAIDQVRYITNFSTGNTGNSLAQAFSKAGWQVLHLQGLGSEPCIGNCRHVSFSTGQDLGKLLKNSLLSEHPSWVIHCAAVSDYTVGVVETKQGFWRPDQLGKIPSDGELILRLNPAPKLVDHIREWASQNGESTGLVAFKLTVGASPEEVQQKVQDLFVRSGARYVVHNDLEEIKGRGRHIFNVYNVAGAREIFEGPKKLALRIVKLLKPPKKSTSSVSADVPPGARL